MILFIIGAVLVVGGLILGWYLIRHEEEKEYLQLYYISPKVC